MDLEGENWRKNVLRLVWESRAFAFKLFLPYLLVQKFRAKDADNVKSDHAADVNAREDICKQLKSTFNNVNMGRNCYETKFISIVKYHMSLVSVK